MATVNIHKDYSLEIDKQMFQVHQGRVHLGHNGSAFNTDEAQKLIKMLTAFIEEEKQNKSIKCGDVDTEDADAPF